MVSIRKVCVRHQFKQDRSIGLTEDTIVVVVLAKEYNIDDDKGEESSLSQRTGGIVLAIYTVTMPVTPSGTTLRSLQIC